MRQDFPPFESGDPASPARPLTRSVNASYRELRRARETTARETAETAKYAPPAAPEDEYASGPSGWLAPLLPPEAAQLTDATLAQRAAPTAWCALILLVVGLGLAAGGLVNQHLLAAGGLLLVGALLAVALNRAREPGWAAGALVVAGMAAPVAVALLSAPGDPAAALALDALVAPVLLAGALLSARAPLMVGGAGALACALVVLPREFGRDPAQPFNPLLSLDLLAPVGLILLVTLIAWLWATTAARALTRTAATATAMTRYASKDEQQALLERGVQALLATLAQVANGHYGVRVDPNARTVLWQLAAPVNALIARLASAAQADQRLRSTEYAIDQLTTALEQARTGQPPLWPSASGTQVDRLTGLLATTTPRLLPAPPTPREGLGSSPHAAMPYVAPVAGARWPLVGETPSSLPAMPQHRAPDEFARDDFAQSHPMAPAAHAHAAAHRMERRWASHPLPPLDAASPNGMHSAPGGRPTVPRPRPAPPARPTELEPPPAVPAWLTTALRTPARTPDDAPPAPPLAPAAPPGAPAPAPASERKPLAEVEWSSTGEVQAIPGPIPPAQSWTIVPVVPAEIERPEWPDFLITLEADQHRQDGEERDV